jgi:hypothetical protein
VLRVLANLLQVPDTDFDSAEQVRAALAAICDQSRSALLGADAGVAADLVAHTDAAWIDLPPYQGDALVRGSEALAKTQDGQLARGVL